MAAKPSDAESFPQGLGKLLSDIGGLMASPGADIAFLQQLQMAIAHKVQSLVQQAMPMPQQQSSVGMGEGMGGPAGASSPLAGPPSGINGVNPLAQAPNPDELRRMIGAGAGQ